MLTCSVLTCAVLQVDDADKVLDVLKEQVPGVPVFLAGNSLGSLVAMNVALRHKAAFAGLVMQSALVDVEWTTVLK